MPRGVRDSTLHWRLTACSRDNGSNPDKGYLDTVMHTLYSHKHIDYDNMVLLGYSAGAQMVSAALSIFPKQSIHKYQ